MFLIGVDIGPLELMVTSLCCTQEPAHPARLRPASRSNSRSRFAAQPDMNRRGVLNSFGRVLGISLAVRTVQYSVAPQPSKAACHDNACVLASKAQSRRHTG